MPVGTYEDHVPGDIVDFNTDHKFVKPHQYNDPYEEQPDHSFADTFTAVARRESWWYNMFNFDVDRVVGAVEEGYDPMEGLSEEQELVKSAYAYDRSPADRESTDRRLQQWKEDDKVIEESGLATNILSYLAVGMVDPDILLPGGIFYKVGKGTKVMNNFLQAAAVSAGTAGILEGSLQAVQPLRPDEELYMSMAGAAILGGAVGAGAGHWASKQIDKTEQLLELRRIAAEEGMPNEVNALDAELIAVQFENQALGKTDWSDEEITPEMFDKINEIRIANNVEPHASIDDINGVNELARQDEFLDQMDEAFLDELVDGVSPQYNLDFTDGKPATLVDADDVTNRTVCDLRWGGLL